MTSRPWYFDPAGKFLETTSRRKFVPLRFETCEDSFDENCRRISMLLKGNMPARKSAKTLMECNDYHYCGSTACHICMGEFRYWHSYQLYRLFKPYVSERLRFLTVVPVELQCGPGKLHTVNPIDMTRAFTRRAQRCGLGDCLIAGGIDFDFCVEDNDIKNGYWQPHFHVIVSDLPEREYQAFKSSYPANADRGVKRPIRRDKIKDRPKQFSYTFKSIHWKRSRFSKEGSSDGTKSGVKRQSLKSAQLREILVYLDKYQPTDFLVHQNVRRYGNKLANRLISKKGSVDEVRDNRKAKIRENRH